MSKSSLIKGSSNFSKNFKILRLLSLSPIVLWPIIYYGVIFIFDAPTKNPRLLLIIFYGIIAYPLYLIVNVYLCNRINKTRPKFATALLSIPIIVFSILIFLIVFGQG